MAQAQGRGPEGELPVYCIKHEDSPAVSDLMLR